MKMAAYIKQKYSHMLSHVKHAETQNDAYQASELGVQSLPSNEMIITDQQRVSDYSALSSLPEQAVIPFTGFTRRKSHIDRNRDLGLHGERVEKVNKTLLEQYLPIQPQKDQYPGRNKAGAKTHLTGKEELMLALRGVDSDRMEFSQL